MAGIQDLIDIQLVDATGYADVENNDILGTVFAHYWGPTNKNLRRFSQQQFRQNYPEVLPFIPQETKNHSILEFMSQEALVSYAQIIKAFANGMGTVEVKNISDLKRCVILHSDSTPQEGSSNEVEWMDDSVIEAKDWAIYLKYRGYVPSSLVSEGALYFNWTSTDTNGLMTITIYNGTNVLEQFTGSFVPNTYVDGQDVYFGTLFQNSDFLGIWVKDTVTEVEVTTGGQATYALPETEGNFVKVTLDNLTVGGGSDKGTMDDFGDIKKSNATLLISPYTFTTNAKAVSLDSRLQQIASGKKTLNFVQGVHTTSELEDFISETLSNQNTKYFNLFVVGQETFKVFGKSVTLNCVAGWCGSTAAIAKQVRLNQLASADAYGDYNGVLTWSPDFEQVLANHKKGFISVYTSDNGPQIFGVRAYLQNQNTYYAKANVMRVLASILKNQIPVLMQGIHTDAAANPLTRRILNSQMNSILGDYIGSNDIAPDSYVDMSDELNNDVDTKGGQILFAVGYLHFYKLVETIKYKIVATDSSVAVELA